MVFSMNFMTSDSLYILRPSIIQLFGTTSSTFLLPIHPLATFFVSFRSPWGSVDQWIVDTRFLLLTCGIISFSWETVHGFFANCKSTPWFYPLEFSTSLVGTFWISSCSGRFLFGGLFVSGWFFLWSSIWVYLFLQCIYSFRSSGFK